MNTLQGYSNHRECNYVAICVNDGQDNGCEIYHIVEHHNRGQIHGDFIAIVIDW